MILASRRGIELFKAGLTIVSMTKARDGFRVLFVQVPEALWDAVNGDAEQEGGSLARVVTRILAKHYRVNPATLPKPKRAGRKPRER
jgi:hypothetical protein